MCTTFSHNFKNIIQNGQNQSCDTIALNRRIVSFRFVLPVESLTLVCVLKYATVQPFCLCPLVPAGEVITVHKPNLHPLCITVVC